ncbi:MAG: SRPBCC domain-containing protein [Alphaproteobacteria bacterium]|nr:SRPBCC domain-containing protein [Alphaproteobacteria bacterium]
MEHAEVTFTREFKAPRALVFDVWTNAKHMKQWFAPDMFSVGSAMSDPRTGGVFAWSMVAPDGAEHWTRGVYEEVVAPEKVVSRARVVDANDKPMFEVLTTARFTEANGVTTLNMSQKVVGVMQPEIAKFAIAGMEEGWRQTLVKFAAAVTGLTGGKS